MPSTSPILPASLARARETFDAWRRTRARRTIPDPLWAKAVALANTHGLAATARALRLDYYSLKRRLDGAARPDAATAPPPVFADWVRPSLPSDGAAEFEDARGACLRLEWRGTAPDLVALARTFLGAAP